MYIFLHNKFKAVEQVKEVQPITHIHKYGGGKSEKRNYSYLICRN